MKWRTREVEASSSHHSEMDWSTVRPTLGRPADRPFRIAHAASSALEQHKSLTEQHTPITSRADNYDRQIANRHNFGTATGVHPAEDHNAADRSSSTGIAQTRQHPLQHGQQDGSCQAAEAPLTLHSMHRPHQSILQSYVSLHTRLQHGCRDCPTSISDEGLVWQVSQA